MLRRLTVVSLFALAFACGAPDDASVDGDDELAGQDLPAPADTPPDGDGIKGDTGYVVTGLKAWYLVGNAITPGNDTVSLKVQAPSSARYIDLWIDSGKGIRLKKSGTTHTVSTSIASLKPGQHTIKLAANGARTAFSKLTFQRSHPLYVFVSNDWDDPDNADDTLRRQETLHQKHPALKITHFVGPYVYTDPSTTPARRTVLTNWVKQQRTRFGDEIGLHIHPWCSFITAAGVTCRTSPSFSEASDSTGYTVILSSYTEAEMGKLLKKADALFQANGLGKPTSFRAGGWTAMAHTLKALANDGFVADGSAVNWARIEEWRGYPGASIFEWNGEHWGDVGDTTQPWYPNVNDASSHAAPTLPILEIPDNGVLVDYVTTREMTEVFQANFGGKALSSPKVVSFGYHPPNFSEAFFQKLDPALAYVDGFLAASDKGPVVYARASELAKLKW